MLFLKKVEEEMETTKVPIHSTQSGIISRNQKKAISISYALIISSIQK